MYITWRQNMVVQYIEARLIMKLCREAERWPGPRVSNRWWEQEGINLAEAQTEAMEADTEEGWEAEN